MPEFRIEALLSARLFLSPQLAGGRIYFISDMTGRFSLYRMDQAGSVPEPLLPREIALQNPALHDGDSFYAFPKLDKVLVMIDHDGDENYQPFFVPLEGGIPEPVFGDRFAGQQVVLAQCDPERNLACFRVDPRRDPLCPSFLVDLAGLSLTHAESSLYGNYPDGHSEDYSQLILIDGYTAGDNVVYLWTRGQAERRLLLGTPLEDRSAGQAVPLNSIHDCHFTPSGSGLLFVTSLFEDRYGLGYFLLPQAPAEVKPVAVQGLLHQGVGEMEGLTHLEEDRYLLTYNIDGASWAYEGTFDEDGLCFRIQRAIVGMGPLAGGVAEHVSYEKGSDSFVLSFATATSPAQIYTVTGPGRQSQAVTRERILGIPSALLAPGEDASYTSHDGLRVSARLYLPSVALGLQPPYPVVFYIHGGPQSQERPNFTWFSMPLIQFLTLHGLAVWVPNVRGSSGYGLDYMKRVDKDWGGQDRLDHVAALEHLAQDSRIDAARAGVMGRSYGGYMTLTLAGRHPDLWRAAVDMFGPYSLFTFIAWLPESWKTYFYLALGDPVKDHNFLAERSPSTYLEHLRCPMLVIQGANDPRVVEAESHDLVDHLRAQGKDIDYLVFDNEGHDVIKVENKVRCYNAITHFFAEKLRA